MNAQFLIDTLDTPLVREAIAKLAAGTSYSILALICSCSALFIIRRVAAGFAAWGRHNRTVHDDLIATAKMRRDDEIDHEHSQLDLRQKEHQFDAEMDEKRAMAKRLKKELKIKRIVEAVRGREEVGVADAARFPDTITRRYTGWVRFIRDTPGLTVYDPDSRQYRSARLGDRVRVVATYSDSKTFRYVLPDGVSRYWLFRDVEPV